MGEPSNKEWMERKHFDDFRPGCDIPVPGIPVPGNSSIFLMVSEPVSKKFGTEKSLGTGLEKNWFQKKSRNRSRKNLVPKKVSEPVSFRFWVSSHTVSPANY